MVLPVQFEHFITFLADKISPSNAFLLPQWGGIVIHNPQTLLKDELPFPDLDAIFSSFAGQLLNLLGVPSLPPHVKCLSDTRRCITDWQLDALLRRRTLENASGSQDTLLSILKLVNQINNMPVGEDVRDDVSCALSALTQVIGFPLPFFLGRKSTNFSSTLLRCMTRPRFRYERLSLTLWSHCRWHLELSSTLVCWHCCTSLRNINTQCIHLCLPVL